MSLTDKIINETREPQDLEGFNNKLHNLVDEYVSMGCQIDVYLRHFFSLELSVIKAPPDRRNQGIASSFMYKLTSLADDHGIIITLSPSNTFGSSVKRLNDFYKRFAFRKNTGSKADHRFSNSMIREPKGYNAIEEAFGKNAEAYVKQNETNWVDRDGNMDMRKIVHDYFGRIDFKEEYSVQAYEAMKEKFGVGANDTKKIFARLGERQTINIEDLSYAQTDVNISGTTTNGPIHVVKTDRKMILWDGYHRVAEAILDDKTQMPAIVVNTIKNNTSSII